MLLYVSVPVSFTEVHSTVCKALAQTGKALDHGFNFQLKLKYFTLNYLPGIYCAIAVYELCKEMMLLVCITLKTEVIYLKEVTLDRF